MRPDRWQRLESLFLRALDLPAAEREAFLTEHCGDDPDLLTRLTSMLAHDGEEQDDLSGPVAEAARHIFMAPAAEPGVTLGAYRLGEEIGRGGMGSVHLAYRSDDEFRKRVAIKIMRGDTANKNQLRRFRAERQILASLDHPGIARLIDGGSTQDGSPYVVMEYVAGEPIDRYCDRHRLSVRSRLMLFRKICAAVEFAHRNLVVHRDLKPANILVDEDGVPRLLDFGIAKMLQPDPDSGSLAVTMTGMRLLTPEYASPEQVRGESITTAADIYALGVLLHHLVSGGMPYQLKTGTAGEMERLICDQEPLRPSSLVQRAGREAGSIAARRGTDPDRLRRTLAGDVDLMVLRALQKDPDRRYHSVEQFSQDIDRHLQGRPIEARPDSWTYRAGKFVGRNPWGTAAVAVILFLVLGASLGLVLQSRRIAGERDRALAAEHEARMEAATAGRVVEFLSELFESPTPEQAMGDDISAREILDRGARRIRLELQDQPAIQARLMATMADAYGSLGLHQDAFPLAEEALAIRRRELGEEAPEYARSLVALGALHTSTADYERADDELTAALGIQQALLGPDHDEIVKSLNLLGILRARQGDYDASEDLHRQAVAMARRLHGDRHRDVGTSLNNLGWTLMREGEYDEAEAAHREGLAIKEEILGPEHPDTLSSINNLATLLSYAGRNDEAEAYAREYLAGSRRLHGAESVPHAVALSGLATILKSAGKAAEAEVMQREARAILRHCLGEEHPLVMMAGNNLANLRQDQGDLEEAEALHREVLEIQTRVRGRRHPETANSIANLANLLWDRGDYEAAMPLMREVLDIDRESVGEKHPFVALDMSNLAVVLRDRGRPQDRGEAEKLFRRSIDIAESALGAENGSVGVYRGEYGVFLARTGRPDQGEAEIRAARRIAETAHGTGHFQIDNATSLLGECFLARREYAEAEELMLGAYQALLRKSGPDAGITRRARQRLARLYAAWNRPDLAARYAAPRGDDGAS